MSADIRSGKTSGNRRITAARFGNAILEDMSVTFTGPGIAEVTKTDGTTYQVELEGGYCECPDLKYRGDSIVCKHVIRGAIAAVYHDDQRTTELAAAVLRLSKQTGCVYEVNGCNGPTMPANRAVGVPCVGCTEAVKSDGVDEYDIWVTFNGDN